MLYLRWTGVSSQPTRKSWHNSPACQWQLTSRYALRLLHQFLSCVCFKSLLRKLSFTPLRTRSSPYLPVQALSASRENAFQVEQVCFPSGGFPGLSTVRACPAPPRASSVSLQHPHVQTPAFSETSAIFSPASFWALRPARMDLGYQVWKRHHKHPGPAACEDDSCVGSDSTWELLSPSPPLCSLGSSGLQHF